MLENSQRDRPILAPSFSALIDSPLLLNSVLISRNDVSSEEKQDINESEDNLSEDKKSISDNKHVGEYMKNLYVNNSNSNNNGEEEDDYIKKSQDLMKSIRNGKVIEYEDVSNEHLASPRETLVVGKNDIGSERFSIKPTTETEKNEKPNDKPKKEKKERRDSGKNDQSSIIDTIFSPFSWIVGGSNSTKRGERNGEQEKKIKSENAPNEENTSSSQSSGPSASNENSNNTEKKAEPSILSTIFSTSLFSSKKNSDSTQSEEVKTEKKERKERKPKTSPLAWIERFGADAGKAASNALKDPLERLASSPVLATGEVIVVHSLDLDGIDFRRIFKYFIFMVFTWRFSNTFFGSIFPALLGRSSKRRIENQPTPQIAYIPQSLSPQYPSISVLPRNTITQL